jgi:hypothetical protein
MLMLAEIPEKRGACRDWPVHETQVQPVFTRQFGGKALLKRPEERYHENVLEPCKQTDATSAYSNALPSRLVQKCVLDGRRLLVVVPIKRNQSSI